MVERGINDFVRKEGRELVIIIIAILVITFLLVAISTGGRLPALSYGDISNLIVAVVATTTLYIGWREFVRKTEPSITVGFDYEYPENKDTSEQMFLKITNSGANIVTPLNAWYGFVRKDKESYYFSNTDISTFDRDGLKPGDTATTTLGDDLVLLRLESVNIRDWTGEGVTTDHFWRDRQVDRLHLVEIHGDAEVKIQKLFDEVMTTPYQFGRRISKETLQSSSFEELVEKHGLNSKELQVASYEDYSDHS